MGTIDPSALTRCRREGGEHRGHVATSSGQYMMTLFLKVIISYIITTGFNVDTQIQTFKFTRGGFIVIFIYCYAKAILKNKMTATA